SDFDLKIKGFSSKRAQTQYRKAGSLWTAEDVVLILALLAKTDMELRSANAALEETLMASLVYGIHTKRDFYA
ncbi:MAG TPA: DNA polymerase III subunit delta, partial [Treponemataceae bacterium]|nr:DNA polymerase III subunit delta [Treponemataceae bacterium]